MTARGDTARATAAPSDLTGTYFESGRTAWPSISLGESHFDRYFARHAGNEPPPISRAPDMYLACACSVGVHGALPALEQHALADVARGLGGRGFSEAVVTEVLQTLRERLLVRGDSSEAKIADYAGRASLKTWLRTVAVRTALSMRRKKAAQSHEPLRESDGNHAGHCVRAAGGPQLEYLRRRYKEAFEDAVRAAILAMPASQRALLRLAIVEGLSVDKLGPMYGVGRSTAARRVAAARAALRQTTHRELHARLGVSTAELESLARDLQSQIDISLATLLAPDSP